MPIQLVVSGEVEMMKETRLSINYWSKWMVLTVQQM